MARLNEPIVSTDNLDTLRRKFLRQNRDIARTNSTQSLKIRSLENECARMLSENLELRGRIIQLETELEHNRAQRIADHALEIKAKMEAQLVEWGTMLAGLGHEPIPRNRSPRAAKKAKIRNSLSRTSLGRTSMSEWRRRETMSSMKDLEAAALQEGRLPPLWENKTYPRETLSRDEILALRSVVEDGGESPDLGPPPVSRFVDEDPVKIDLPNTSSAINHAASPTRQSLSPQPETQLSPPSITMKEQETGPKKAEPTYATSNITMSATEEPPSPSPAGKASLKRKTRDEDEKEETQQSRPPPQLTLSTKNQSEKLLNAKARPVGRPIKELPPKRDARHGLAASAPRKPLGAKSSNDIINSPKKASTKPPVQDEVAKAKADMKREEQNKERTKPKKDTTPIEIPSLAPPPAPVASIEIEQDHLSPEPQLTAPDSPEPLASKEETRDTPPPADISSRGETSRGSRRARAAVSYAEPNLRDKMRRPTKQLLDAVSGEGKNIRRTSQSMKDEPFSGPSSVVKSESRSVPCKDVSTARSTSSDANHADIMASPLIQKTVRSAPLDDLPISISTDRKKRNSSAVVSSSEPESSGGSNTKSASKGPNRRLEEIAAREEEVAKIFERPDIYEFTSSPKDGAKSAAAPAPAEDAPKRRAGRPASSRRGSAMVREDPDPSEVESSSEKPATTGGRGGPRKRGSRASMMLPKKSKMDVEDHDSPNIEGDSLESTSSAEVDSSTTGSRASIRRRSMML
ncbi:hypothetical protein F4775DRAFT_566244 [Biscogniauxia sp. FL1348]|nr:hypothetical protein F4775DRAFT_566244 [Biscogniauxia sp. FL1348]